MDGEVCWDSTEVVREAIGRREGLVSDVQSALRTAEVLRRVRLPSAVEYLETPIFCERLRSNKNDTKRRIRMLVSTNDVAYQGVRRYGIVFNVRMTTKDH